MREARRREDADQIVLQVVVKRTQLVEGLKAQALLPSGIDDEDRKLARKKIAHATAAHIDSWFAGYAKVIP